MKGMIISDDQEVINSINNFLQSHKIDTIIYRWLLKAMDNVEEIRPDLIIVSANEYPRHWKTLCQFVSSGIGGTGTEIILFEKNPLSEDDKKKAEALGVKGFFSEMAELEKLLSPVSETSELPPSLPDSILDGSSSVNDSTEGSSAVTFDDEDDFVPTVDNIVFEKTQEEKTVDVSGVAFTHPESKKLILGKILSYRDDIISAQIDYPEMISDLSFGDGLKSVFFETEQAVKSYTATVLSKIDNEISFKLEKNLYA